MILPSGAEYNPVALTYAVLPPCLVLLIGYFYQKANRVKIEFIPKLLALPILSLILLSLVLSQSRSGVLAVFVCLILVIFICIKVNKKFIPISTLLSIVLIFSVFAAINNSAFDGIINKAGKIDSDMRTGGTWSIFMPVLMEYPLGVPKDVRDLEHSNRSSIGGHSKKNYEEAMRRTEGYDPHNIFITAAVYFGIPVAVLMVFLYLSLLYGAFRQILRRKLTDIYDVYLMIFFIINCSILIHGWFHNASIVFGEMRLWFWLGMLISYYWIAKQKQLIKT
jgi:O-antigen ligase